MNEAAEDGIEEGPNTTITYNWQDVTSDFMQACGQLEMGELMHGSNFGLFEAMSAIEMMDVKMDAGMMCNQAKRKVLNLQQAIQNESVKVRDVSLSELLDIIDDTFACLVTWLEGHSLAQTVFTNLYLHNPYIIEDRPLKAFSVCLLKIVDIMRELANKTSVYEEEDFQPMSYGFKMAGDVTEARSCGMMKEAEEDINRIVKYTRSKSGQQLDDEQETEHQQALGVFARLRFTRLLYVTLVSLAKEKCQGVSDAKKTLNQILQLLPQIQSTMSLGITAPTENGEDTDCPVIMGFEPLVNQRLLPPTFPRYTRICSRGETWRYITNMALDLQHVCKITNIGNIHNAIIFFTEFSKSSQCVLCRSILQWLYLPPNKRILGTEALSDNLRDSIRSFLAPPALMPRNAINNNAQAKEYIDAFLQHAARPISSILRILGHNRARQRDIWGHLLEELASLQDEADKVDAYLHNVLKKVEANRQHLACFGNWVLHHTLQAMINYLLAGFELELYAVHEYHYIYWYLFECLYNWQISTLSRADTFLLEQEAITEQQQKGRGSKKSRKKKKVRPHCREVQFAQAMQNLCGGYYRAIMGLELAGKLEKPKFDFDSEEVRYVHRFAAFSNVSTPPPVAYAHFKEMTDINKYEPPAKPEDLYAWAGKCFQQARAAFEALPNPDNESLTFTKIAKTNLIVMKLLIGGHKKDSQDPPEFDFSQHKVFPVIKLQ